VAICGYMWLYVAICGYMWLYVAICGYMWLYVAICGYTTDLWSVWHDLQVSGGIRYEFLSPAPDGLKFSASNSCHLRPGNSTDAYRIRGRGPRRDGCLAKEKGHVSQRNRISISRLRAFKRRTSLC